MSGEGLDEKAPEFGGNYSGEGEEAREENVGLGTENEERFSVGDDEGMVDFGEGEELREEKVKLGAENEKSETMQLSSSNKKVNPMSIDRLSELPDSLLIHILSFLDVKQAAVTSVLSKRWQFVWSDLPKLEFFESNMLYWDSNQDWEKIGRFVSWVNKAVAIRTVNYLEDFAVWFQYSGRYSSDVDAWVEFALKTKVKKLSLMLNSYQDYYMLPDAIYSNSSVKRLWVRGCIVAPQRAIEWPSLTQLYLKEVEVNQNVIDDIFLGCPVLFSLNLDGCWGFDRLEVNSRSLHRLRVQDCEDDDDDDDDDDERVLEISAPYAHILDISVFPKGRKFQVKNIQSLLKACINFIGCGWDSTSVEVMSIAKDLLESFLLVKELDLGREFFEVVSMMVVNDWQLPQSTRLYLQVSTASDYEHSISSIIGLLESSSNLVSLVIMGDDTDSDIVDLDPATKDDLNRDLPKLRTVHIRYFTDPKGEPMLTLVRILLKRATFLEKMVIVTDDDMALDDFDYIGQKLHTFPVSSQRAVVLLH